MSELSVSEAPCLILPEKDDYDTWVVAGGRLFRAHGAVLAAHSAYLSATVGEGLSGGSRVLLPHVPAAGFAAILAYMYTGRLPVTSATMYEVLVAAHLLQMPSVVSLCHALVQSSATPAGALLLPAAVGPSVPPALSVWQSLARLVPQVRGHSQSSKPSLVRPTPTRLRPDAAQTLSPAPRPEDASSGSGLLQEDAMDVDEAASLRHHQEVKPQSQSSARREPSRCSLAATSSTSTSSSNTSSSGHVILDIAACDGPVFFERIINKAYGSQASSQDDSEDDGDINVEDLDSGDEGVSGNALVGGPHDEDTVKSSLCNSSTGRTYHCVYCNHTFKSHYCYQKHKRRHINPITIELNKLRGTTAPQNSRPVTTVVNITPPAVRTTPPPPLPPAPSISSALASTPSSSSSNNEGGGVLETGSSSITSNTSLRLSPTFSGKASLASSSPLSHSSSGEGEVKVLDLNVQYFPCKTCGSKFPSYYFVHKHRRLCHADEENQSKGATTTGGIGGSTLSGPSQKPKDNSTDRPKPGHVPSLHAQTSTSTSAPASPKVAPPPPPPPPPPPLPPQPRPTTQPQQEQEDQQEQQQMPQIPPSAEPR